MYNRRIIEALTKMYYNSNSLLFVMVYAIIIEKLNDYNSKICCN